MKYFAKYLSEGESRTLFICSRDIKIGDMVYPPIEEGYDPNVPMLCISENMKPPEDTPIVRLFWAIEGKWYKKIGRVSRYATWVKEYDEFDHKDIALNGIWQNWNSETPLNEKGIVFIKGKCGRFH